jgi:hypothetical protein
VQCRTDHRNETQDNSQSEPICAINILTRRIHQEQPMSFAIYIVGVVIFIGGLIYGAVLMNIPEQWIAVMAIILLGLSVLVGVNQTRQKDPAA